MIDVREKPVPATEDFAEILRRYEVPDILRLQDDIDAVDTGQPLSALLLDILDRADCVAEANRIMVRLQG